MQRKRNPDDDFDDEEQIGPDLEDAYVIQDERGPGYSVYLSGKRIGTFETWGESLKAIVQYSEKHGYYPDVYYVNERGNTDLLSLRKRGRGYTSKVIKSWV